MADIVYEIGVFVVTTILYAIPILTACSFIYQWDGFFQVALIIASIIEFCGLSVLIGDEVSRGE
jgi:hypothetical protein